jgi:hypothetical protein
MSENKNNNKQVEKHLESDDDEEKNKSIDVQSNKLNIIVNSNNENSNQNKKSEKNTKIIIDNNIKKLFESKFNGSSTYFDIVLYNCYNIETSELDLDKLDKAIDDIVDVYQALFSVSMSMSSFQFIGLFLQSNGDQIINLYIKFAYFILSVGFMISLFGVLLSFIVIEYLKGIRDEEPEFIIAGINHYKSRFKLADIVIYINCACFIIPINLLIYKNIGTRFGIVFNIISFILFFLGIYFHSDTIIKKQRYSYIYNENKSTRTVLFEYGENIINCVSKFLPKNNTVYNFNRKIYLGKKN